MPARLNPEIGRGYRFVDRSGQRSGRLQFVRAVGHDKHGKIRWEAVCDCGSKTVTTSPHVTRSCGCLQREAARNRQIARRLPASVKAQSRRRAAAKQRERRKADPLAVMHARLSRLHRFALQRVGGVKTSPTMEQLGYTAAEFVAHIERQFLPGMGWHNVSEWQIDHIIPISTAKSVADVVALNQLPNLRPMWADENNAKRARRINLL